MISNLGERGVGKNAKIAFVDFDGVLNGHEFRQRSQSMEIRRDCVERLNGILDETGAYVVLSSAWRYMIIGRAMSLTGFEYLMRTHGVHAGVLVGMTCADEEILPRGEQIAAWREKAGHVGPYVVLDDRDGEWRMRELHGYHFVQTDGNAGLTDDDAKRAIYVLGMEGEE